MKVEKLTTQQVESRLNEYPNWSLKKGKLHRVFKFRDFVQAWGFMTQVALLAEKANHHPEWKNVYDRVTIDLITHEVDGISQRDFDLIDSINNIPE